MKERIKQIAELLQRQSLQSRSGQLVFQNVMTLVWLNVTEIVDIVNVSFFPGY